MIGEKQRGKSKEWKGGKKRRMLGKGELERGEVGVGSEPQTAFDIWNSVDMITNYTHTDIQCICYIEGLEFYISLCMTTGPL